MKNPYEVLGLREGASIDEIKRAYRNLVKKYHPDKYRNNPLADLAEAKLQEINEAYDYLMKNSTSQKQRQSWYKAGTTYSSTSTGRTTSSDNEYLASQAKMHINSGNLSEAQRLLDLFKVRDASWYYLQGLLFLKRGWYDRAYTLLQRAVNMEPFNLEYRSALDRLNSQFSGYRRNYYNYRGYNQSPDMCQICGTLWCADCCCECFGGDLITCC